MAEDVKVKIGNKIMYGAIAGVVGNVVAFILNFLQPLINLGFDIIDYNSQQILGTTAGNPNLVGYFILQIVGGVFQGIIFGIIIFLLMTRAGWERDLTRYLIVAIVYAVVFSLLFWIPIIAMAELDLIVDSLIQLIITLIVALIFGLTFYYLEEQFDSTS